MCFREYTGTWRVLESTWDGSYSNSFEGWNSFIVEASRMSKPSINIWELNARKHTRLKKTNTKESAKFIQREEWDIIEWKTQICKQIYKCSSKTYKQNIKILSSSGVVVTLTPQYELRHDVSDQRTKFIFRLNPHKKTCTCSAFILQLDNIMYPKFVTIKSHNHQQQMQGHVPFYVLLFTNSYKYNHKHNLSYHNPQTNFPELTTNIV